jgi:hypothetical protein
MRRSFSFPRKTGGKLCLRRQHPPELPGTGVLVVGREVVLDATPDQQRDADSAALVLGVGSPSSLPAAR